MASDMFLKLDKVPGESQAKGFEGQIDIASFSWGVSNPSTTHLGGGGGAGKASFSDMSFTHLVDKSSPTLMNRCADGGHLATAILTVRKQGGTPLDYYVIKLTDVLVSSVQHSGADGNGIPMESFSLNFPQIEFAYKEQDNKGAQKSIVEFKWNIAKNTKV